MKPLVIGLIAPAPRSGKSTVGDYLCERFEYKRHSLADTPRAMMWPFLQAFGYSPSDAQLYLTQLKDTPLSLIPGQPTARHLLRTLMSEWGIGCVSPTTWVDIWLQKTFFLDSRRTVSDDVRRPSEVAAVRRHPAAQVWRIIRPGFVYDGDREEENGLSDIPVDAEIINDGTLLDLYAKIDALLK